MRNFTTVLTERRMSQQRARLRHQVLALKSSSVLKLPTVQSVLSQNILPPIHRNRRITRWAEWSQRTRKSGRRASFWTNEAKRRVRGDSVDLGRAKQLQEMQNNLLFCFQAMRDHYGHIIRQTACALRLITQKHPFESRVTSTSPKNDEERRARGDSFDLGRAKQLKRNRHTHEMHV